MTAYFIRRILLIIPTFLGITILVFTITRFVPGGPIERM
ncbi:MAG: ABC transporter permease, partial [Deltaproteobacteria bacterium]|nr:ABC transporter permease [Deltaproteobacteria bacterium]